MQADGDTAALQRSSRATDDIPHAMSQWLAQQIPCDQAPEVTVHNGISATGMSSETIVLSGRWTEHGKVVDQKWVARVAPMAADVPVFPTYRLDHQFEVMRSVEKLSDVPVPRVRWFESTGDVLGAPFFLMDFVAGDVPPDVLPYTFGDNWFANATIDQRATMQQRFVDIIAALHAIPQASDNFGFLTTPDGGHDGAGVQHQLRWLSRWYHFCTQESGPAPLLDRMMAWLHAHAPAENSAEGVLLWGDARIGNMLWSDLEPVAVLDWEMASVGAPEFDLAWGIFAHRVFNDLALAGGLPGLPDVMVERDILAAYRTSSGATVGDLHWYYVYCAAAWCCIFLRTTARRVRFGEMAPLEDVESVYMHRSAIEALVPELA